MSTTNAGTLMNDLRRNLEQKAARAELNAELERYKYAQSWRGKLARLWAWVCFPLIG